MNGRPAELGGASLAESPATEDKCAAEGTEPTNPPTAPPTKEKVELCHATGSATNPFNLISVSKRGALCGHAGESHQDGRDIIPSFTYVDRNGDTQTFPGQNLTTVDSESSTTSARLTPPSRVSRVLRARLVLRVRRELRVRPGPVPAPAVTEPVAVLPITVTMPPLVQPTVMAPSAGQPVARITGLTATTPSVVRATTTVRGASAGPVARANQPSALPFTGSATDTLLTSAAGQLLLGCASAVAGRRRKTVHAG
ncbi:MAG: hypothetical protein ACR2K2_06955 [Mycobacteriales bacterium]